MYLAYKPPMMLPTQTLNPTTSASAAPSATGKVKRSLGDLGGFTNKNVLKKRKEPVPADKWWWLGVGMTALGGVTYYYF